MRKMFLLWLVATMLSSCTTLNRSLKLGATLGSITGSAATLAGYSAGGRTPSLGTVAIGASIGATIGLITSYFVHKQVARDRASTQLNVPQMYFGDLPPSPFIVPKPETRKGGQ